MHITPLPSPFVGIDDADRLDDAAAGFAPHCPGCLRTSDPWEAGRSVAWRCPECGLALIG